MATLIHDDVLDAAPLRRGLPTVVATAGPRAGHGPRRPALLPRLRRARRAGRGSARSSCSPHASVGLALGELAQRRDEFDLGVSAERYLERCRLKTASLFECACLIGRARRPTRPWRPMAREIGLAFQLLDDVLDVAGPPERTGKARGTDLLDGTVTMPLILARDRDPALAGLDLRSLDEPRRRGGLRADRRDRCPRRRPRRRAPAGRGREARARGGRDRAKPSASCCCSSPTASSSATPKAAGAAGLEVFGQDLVRGEGGEEALGALLHVRLGQQLTGRRGPAASRRRGSRRSGPTVSCSCTPPAAPQAVGAVQLDTSSVRGRRATNRPAGPGAIAARADLQVDPGPR